MKYTIKPIVCDYAVISVDANKIVCICNIKRNAELIADILNGDTDNSCAYSYDIYPNAKYKVVKAESEDKEGDTQHDCKRIDNKTYLGIAEAMAEPYKASPTGPESKE